MQKVLNVFKLIVYSHVNTINKTNNYFLLSGILGNCLKLTYNQDMAVSINLRRNAMAAFPGKFENSKIFKKIQSKFNRRVKPYVKLK